MYCAKCGNTGVIPLTNEQCDCRLNKEFLFDSIACLDVPEQYQGLTFNEELVDSDMGGAYKAFLSKTHSDLTSMKLKYHNLLICSPPSTSKTIWTYSIMQTLFRKGIDTFPLYDIYEIKRILLDMDFGRKGVYEVENPESIITVPYLFTRIPILVESDAYEVIAMLLDRRVRRGTSTIFLHNGSWESLTRKDSFGIMSSLVGDGSYCTLENKTWRKLKE